MSSCLEIRCAYSADLLAVDDLSDPAVDGIVYGGSRCADYGWLHAKDDPSTVNMQQDNNGRYLILEMSS